MVRILDFMSGRVLMLVCLGLLLMVSTPASGWHQEDEQQPSRHGATAGIPGALEDAEQCLNDIRPAKDAQAARFAA